jgi:hypothetical protein
LWFGEVAEEEMKNMMSVEMAEKITDKTMKGLEWFCKYILNPYALAGGFWIIMYACWKISER